jgi:hypothetical protein
VDNPAHRGGFPCQGRLLALFARVGATPAARKTLTEAGGMVDLPTRFADLAEASGRPIISDALCFPLS